MDFSDTRWIPVWCGRCQQAGCITRSAVAVLAPAEPGSRLLVLWSVARRVERRDVPAGSHATYPGAAVRVTGPGRRLTASPGESFPLSCGQCDRALGKVCARTLFGYWRKAVDGRRQIGGVEPAVYFPRLCDGTNAVEVRDLHPAAGRRVRHVTYLTQGAATVWGSSRRPDADPWDRDPGLRADPDLPF